MTTRTVRPDMPKEGMAIMEVIHALAAIAAVPVQVTNGELTIARPPETKRRVKTVNVCAGHPTARNGREFLDLVDDKSIDELVLLIKNYLGECPAGEKRVRVFLQQLKDAVPRLRGCIDDAVGVVYIEINTDLVQPF